MTTLEIIGVAQSNFVWTCRIACAEKGVAHALNPARPHTADVDAIHPMGRIPVMRHGDVSLFESKAICAYIDRAFPGPGLVPAGAAGAAECEQWISFINTSFDPVCVRQYALGYFFPGTPDKSPNRAIIDPALPGVEKHLAIIDRAVAATGHLAGPGFTLADIFLLPIAHYLKGLPESGAMIGKLPALSAWCERHMARPSFISTTPPPPPKR